MGFTVGYNPRESLSSPALMPKVAAIQLNSGSDLDRNLHLASRYLRQAAEMGAVLAVLPENFSLMPEEENERFARAESAGSGPVQSFLSEQAVQLGMWVVGGSISLRDPTGDRLCNSCLVYDSEGAQIARYDKIHLFDIDLAEGESYRESTSIRPGTRPQLVETPAGRTALSICYDLRFPALYNYYSERGAELILVPAAFTATTGRAHWRTLLRARAIENLAYVLAPAQTGNHPAGRRTWGHSMIIDPWGEVLAHCEQGIGVIVADIDLARVAELRQRLPVLQHRRPELLVDD